MLRVNKVLGREGCRWKRVKAETGSTQRKVVQAGSIGLAPVVSVTILDSTLDSQAVKGITTYKIYSNIVCSSFF